MMGYGVRDLRPKKDKNDLERLRNFLSNASQYATLLMRAPLRNLEEFTGWWHAALRDGTDLQGLAVVEGTATNIYGEDEEALEAMAKDMLRRVRNMPASGPGAHQLIGDAGNVDTYWRVFQACKRTVVHDRKRLLFATSTPAEPPQPNLSVEPANANDLKVIYAFCADYSVEQWGMDPRRLSPASHEAACRRAIESGRQLVARDRGRPVFIAEAVQLDDNTAMIDKIHVPRPFRVRKRMVTSALIKAAEYALRQASEVLFFADTDNQQLCESAEQAGFEVKRNYRLIVMRAS